MQAGHTQHAECLETLFISHTDATLKYCLVRLLNSYNKKGIMQIQPVLQQSMLQWLNMIFPDELYNGSESPLSSYPSCCSHHVYVCVEQCV